MVQSYQGAKHMKSIEFMYWLQGYFEVIDEPEISQDNLQKIKNHLNMARITDQHNLLPFCNWLSGFIDSCDATQLNVLQTEKIKNKLNNLFSHVVKDYKAERVTNMNSLNNHISNDDNGFEALC